MQETILSIGKFLFFNFVSIPVDGMAVFIVKFIVPYIHDHRFQTSLQLQSKLVGSQTRVLIIDLLVFRYINGGAKSHIGIGKEAKDVAVINRYGHDLAVEFKSTGGLGGQYNAGYSFLNGQERLFWIVSCLRKDGYGIIVF
ncbi:hypothetical protein SDC9_204164 [bioreactor metagenome]|uniref:Uncharacterized protein n=1 Tax=bioreactor metagenome TaxID=1076179 RepID=A0A645J7M6_9ZZZZ